MARGKDYGKGGRRRKAAGPTLRLARTEPHGPDGIMLYYEAAGGGEETWLLEQTSMQEFLALLMKGRMRKGRRMVMEAAEVTIEPPEKLGGPPLLCVATGPLISCTTLDVSDLKGLRFDIDRLLKRLE